MFSVFYTMLVLYAYIMLEISISHSFIICHNFKYKSNG